MDASPMSFEEAVQCISRAGLRMTRPREALLRLILGSHGPFSVKALHEQAEHAGLNIHLTTVHRNLAEFVAVGLVDELPGDDQRLYALHAERESGAHVYCMDCRLVLPLAAEDAEMHAALSRALRMQGFNEATMRLMLTAHCRGHGDSAQVCTNQQSG